MTPAWPPLAALDAADRTTGQRGTSAVFLGYSEKSNAYVCWNYDQDEFLESTEVDLPTTDAPPATAFQVTAQQLEEAKAWHAAQGHPRGKTALEMARHAIDGPSLEAVVQVARECDACLLMRRIRQPDKSAKPRRNYPLQGRHGQRWRGDFLGQQHQKDPTSRGYVDALVMRDVTSRCQCFGYGTPIGGDKLPQMPPPANDVHCYYPSSRRLAYCWVLSSSLETD